MSNGVDFAVSADLKYILITKDVKKVRPKDWFDELCKPS